MRKTITLSGRAPSAAAIGILCFTAIVAASGCDKKAETAGTPEATSASAAPTAPPTDNAPAATAVATAAEPLSAAPTASAAAKPSGSAVAGAAPSGSAAAGAKTFDCGAKGQKPCPMQGWMKSVMASASSSGDGEKLASALSFAGARPPPGFGNWTSIASAGAAKAKAGDIDGAKASCKQCHDTYKEKYKTTMRDRPF
jgi:hypothetical protein